MQGEQTEEKSLQMLIGAQVSAVTFVQDYAQLHFDGPRLTVFLTLLSGLGIRLFLGASPVFVMLCATISQRKLLKHGLLTVIAFPTDLQTARR